MKMRVGIGTAFLSLMAGISLLIPSQAQAAPIGTVHVVPSLEACSQTGLEVNVQCGAAYVDMWLAHNHASEAVQETVLVQRPSMGVWLRPDLRIRCGYIDTPIFALGLHNCAGMTFVDLNTKNDRMILASRVWSMIVLAHESGHGMQERAGLDPVTMTVTNNLDGLFPLEQSADCWAGMATRWWTDQHILPITSQETGDALMRAIGVEGERGHGSPGQRQRAFDAGFLSGAPACNAIVGRAGVFPG